MKVFVSVVENMDLKVRRTVNNLQELGEFNVIRFNYDRRISVNFGLGLTLLLSLC